MESGLLPETCLAHSFSEQESVGKWCQIHGALVGEEVSAWLQERIAGIDEALDLTVPTFSNSNWALGSLISLLVYPAFNI
jgi:hypothetical protein